MKRGQSSAIKANSVLIKPRSSVKDKKTKKQNKTKMTIKTEQHILPMNSNFYKVIARKI